NAYIEGVSASSRTKLHMVIQDVDASIIEVKLQIDSATLEFDENCQSDIIVDLKNGVYTISLKAQKTPGGSERFLEFWGIPSSFPAIAEPRCVENCKFKAKVRAT